MIGSETIRLRAAWLLARAQQLDPEAWKAPFPDKLTARRLAAVWKAKDEWDANRT